MTANIDNKNEKQTDFEIFWYKYKIFLYYDGSECQLPNTQTIRQTNT